MNLLVLQNLVSDQNKYIEVTIKDSWSRFELLNSLISTFLGCIVPVFLGLMFLRTQERIKQRDLLNLEYGKTLRRKILSINHKVNDIEKNINDIIKQEHLEGKSKKIEEDIDIVRDSILDLDIYGHENFEIIHKIAPDLRKFCRDVQDIISIVERIRINESDIKKNKERLKKIKTEIYNASQESYIIDMSLWLSFRSDKRLITVHSAFREGCDAHYDKETIIKNVQNALEKEIESVPYLESEQNKLFTENYSIEKENNTLVEELNKILTDFNINIKNFDSLILENYFKVIYTKKELKEIKRKDYFEY